MSSSPAAPNTPQAPSLTDQINSYVSSLPSLYGASQTYDPLFAQQQYQLTSQYAPQYAAIQQSLYPELTSLQNNIASTASSNISNGMPAAMAKQYQDQFRGQIGDNNNSGIGADYVSRAMQAQQQQYAQSWAQIGNAATGQNPLYNISSYSAPSMYNSYTPQSALNYGQGTYGSYANSYASMYNTNANYENDMFKNYMALGQSVAGGVGAGMQSGGKGGMSAALMAM